MSFGRPWQVWIAWLSHQGLAPSSWRWFLFAQISIVTIWSILIYWIYLDYLVEMDRVRASIFRPPIWQDFCSLTLLLNCWAFKAQASRAACKRRLRLGEDPAHALQWLTVVGIAKGSQRSGEESVVGIRLRSDVACGTRDSHGTDVLWNVDSRCSKMSLRIRTVGVCCT